MSDTPRTDGVMKYCFGSDEEFIKPSVARQLERELKDARQIASKYDDRYFATRELLNVSTERAESLERELAAANARIRRLEEALDLTSSQCGDLHHPKGHQHALGQPCPVEEIVRKAKEATR